jgi:hypothetical protein
VGFKARLKGTLAALVAAALCCAALAPPAQAEFGLNGVDVAFTENAAGDPATQAGSHPFAMTISFRVNGEETPVGGFLPDGAIRDTFFAQPEGLVAAPAAVPRCTSVDFLTADCADSSALGAVAVQVVENEEIVGASLDAPVYSLVPAPGTVATLGFWVLGVPIVIDVDLSEDPPYRVVAGLTELSQVLEVYGAQLTLWGVPASPAHDAERGACQGTGEECPVTLPEAPFLTLPRSCSGTLTTRYAADSWQHPGARLANGEPDLSDPAWATGTVASPGMSGCGKLGFGLELSAQPTSEAASSATGLDLSLETRNQGLADPGGVSDADLERAVLTLPEGMAVNPSRAEGLEVCSEAELARESVSSVPGEGCPEASKVGTAEVESPLLESPLTGSFFVAEPYRNLAGDSLLALYMVVRNRDLGMIVKQPLEARPDPRTGRLTVIADDLPQLPFSSLRLHFREGGRALLIAPPDCGSFEVEARLHPSSGGEPVTSTSAFQIVAGPNGGGCPASPPPFQPGFEAGTLNNAAGRFSPFLMRITRGDGEQDLTRLSSVLPPGVVARLAGIPPCPDALIAAARSRSGEAELAAPSCPAASQLGRVAIGTGAGSQLTYVGGALYLAGPTGGAPRGLAIVVPAVVGPFDLGTVVLREALRLDPRTAQVAIDGRASAPIPHILEGIPLSLRDLRVYVERPGFTLNATSCEPSLSLATLWGGGTAFAPAGEAPTGLAARYQAAGCAALGFKPRLKLRLLARRSGRGAFPRLRVVLRPRGGDANARRLAVLLPGSELLENTHIRTVCTREQYAAGGGLGAGCPKGAIYGHAKVWTPLLGQPLSGPVYLRSSTHKLPDLVLSLHGLFDLELVGRIDSVRGRIRVVFAGIPDAPLSRVALSMKGGRKGLLANSTDLCRGAHRARVRLAAHNARRRGARPRVTANCKKARKKGKKRGGKGQRGAKGKRGGKKKS